MEIIPKIVEKFNSSRKFPLYELKLQEVVELSYYGWKDAPNVLGDFTPSRAEEKIRSRQAEGKHTWISGKWMELWLVNNKSEEASTKRQIVRIYGWSRKFNAGGYKNAARWINYIVNKEFDGQREAIELEMKELSAVTKFEDPKLRGRKLAQELMDSHQGIL